MRYIKEGPFLDRKGEQVVMPLAILTGKGLPPTREPTVGNLMLSFLNGYEPNADLRISVGDMKNKVWPALDVLEKGPNDRGFYVLDNSAFEI